MKDLNVKPETVRGKHETLEDVGIDKDLLPESPASQEIVPGIDRHIVCAMKTAQRWGQLAEWSDSLQKAGTRRFASSTQSTARLHEELQDVTPGKQAIQSANGQAN